MNTDVGFQFLFREGFTVKMELDVDERILSYFEVIFSQRGNDQLGRVFGIGDWSSSLFVDNFREEQFCFKEVREWIFCRKYEFDSLFYCK